MALNIIENDIIINCIFSRLDYKTIIACSCTSLHLLNSVKLIWTDQSFWKQLMSDIADCEPEPVCWRTLHKQLSFLNDEYNLESAIIAKKMGYIDAVNAIVHYVSHNYPGTGIDNFKSGGCLNTFIPNTEPFNFCAAPTHRDLPVCIDCYQICPNSELIKEYGCLGKDFDCYSLRKSSPWKDKLYY